MGEEILPARTFSRDKADKLDLLVAASSGALTGTVDAIFGDFSFTEVHKDGEKIVSKLICRTAKLFSKKEFDYSKNDDLEKAVRFLENQFPYAGDCVTDEFGGGRQHHLRDFSHHCSPVGLVFSLLSQFTGMAYGTDVNGNFTAVKLPQEILAKDIPGKLYMGTVTWACHLISDMAGSSSSIADGKEGTGIPGPMLSMLKTISSVPKIKDVAGDNEQGRHMFSLTCSKLFNGTLLNEEGAPIRFDLRTEIGIAKANMLPVLLNELIVRAFYSVRRFAYALNEVQVHSLQELPLIDPAEFLPWNSKALTHMVTLASVTFSVIDISAAGVKAALKNRGNKEKFVVDFLQGINFVGIGRLALAGNSELALSLSVLYDKFTVMADRLLQNVGLDYKQTQTLAVDAAEGVTLVMGLGTPLGVVAAADFAIRKISQALEEARLATAERIQAERTCKEHIETILQHREEMETAVTEYMLTNLHAFNDAMDRMDHAMMSGDVDGYLNANADLQTHLGKKPSFANMREFDEFMNSEDDFEL